jgi:ankyrin repeat protein
VVLGHTLLQRKTPLHVAAERGDAVALCLVLAAAERLWPGDSPARRAYLNEPDSSGDTALLASSRNG